MGPATGPAIWWVRRDFRLARQPGAARRARRRRGRAAAVRARPGAAAPRPERPGGPGCMAALHALDADLRDAGGPGLSVVRGRPATACRGSRRRSGPPRCTSAADFAPYGRAPGRAASPAALADAGIELIAGPDRRTRSPRAPCSTSSGGPFQVFSPFHRAWARARRPRPGPGRPRRLGRLARRPRTGSTLAQPTPSWSSWPGRRRRSQSLAGVAGAGLRGRRATTRSCTTSPDRTPPRTCPSPCAGGTCIPRTVLHDLASHALRRGARAGPPDRLAGLLRRRAACTGPMR